MASIDFSSNSIMSRGGDGSDRVDYALFADDNIERWEDEGRGMAAPLLKCNDEGTDAMGQLFVDDNKELWEDEGRGRVAPLLKCNEEGTDAMGGEVGAEAEKEEEEGEAAEAPPPIRIVKSGQRMMCASIVLLGTAAFVIVLRIVIGTFFLVDLLDWDPPDINRLNIPRYIDRPDIVYELPYAASSYYWSTRSVEALRLVEKFQAGGAGGDDGRPRLAIVRPFCEFDAEALRTTFDCWNALPPCAAAPLDVAVDLFLYFSQIYSENDVAVIAVDRIVKYFFSDIDRGEMGWPQCFDKIYAIEGNIPQELDLYIPVAQDELYNWVNGPNRQFEGMYRTFQTGNWGTYKLGVYLMEGDSVPVKSFWLDKVVEEIKVNRPFAILGSRYTGDKWDDLDGINRGTYGWAHTHDKIPVALVNHTGANSIYNTSHPLLERMVSQIEVEAPGPYNSVPFDYRMSQMWVEGLTGEVPRIAPKLLLNEEGGRIELPNNTAMFRRWADAWRDRDPFRYTEVLAEYAATNMLPRHIGEEHVLHGAKLYAPWDPTMITVTLVVSEGASGSKSNESIRPLLESLDRSKGHPFSEVVRMLPALASGTEGDLLHDRGGDVGTISVQTQRRQLGGMGAGVTVRTQRRQESVPAFMDLCEVDVDTEWFMITTVDHRVRRRVSLMFTPGSWRPVIPFTPATYPFCFKYDDCKETVNLAQRFNPGNDKVVQDMDMLFNAEAVAEFCSEWKGRYGRLGEKLYDDSAEQSENDDRFDDDFDPLKREREREAGPSGPTATSYYAYLVSQRIDGMYRMTDRSLYGARPAFVKLPNSTNDAENGCECSLLDDETDCLAATDACGCAWRPRFESCHDKRGRGGSVRMY